MRQTGPVIISLFNLLTDRALPPLWTHAAFTENRPYRAIYLLTRQGKMRNRPKTVPRQHAECGLGPIICKRGQRTKGRDQHAMQEHALQEQNPRFPGRNGEWV